MVLVPVPDGEKTPKRYRLIPVSVEAIKLTPENVRTAALWCGGKEIEEIDPMYSTKRFSGLNIPTLSGVIRAHQTDYIVKSGSGHVTVMSEREFESKYELV